ncbi:hypothetical protein TRV_05189, partial [Trichophyton verrucosum HKI 0517]
KGGKGVAMRSVMPLGKNGVLNTRLSDVDVISGAFLTSLIYTGEHTFVQTQAADNLVPPPVGEQHLTEKPRVPYNNSEEEDQKLLADMHPMACCVEGEVSPLERKAWAPPLHLSLHRWSNEGRSQRRPVKATEPEPTPRQY